MNSKKLLSFLTEERGKGGKKKAHGLERLLLL
jgi:hypothetical protein